MRWRLAAIGILLILGTSATGAAQEPPPCPEDSRDETRGSLRTSDRFQWTIDLKPCQVLTVTVTVTPSQSRYSTLARVEAFNRSGGKILSEQQLGTSTMTLMLPQRAEPWIPRPRPEYYGVRGDPGLPFIAVLTNPVSDPASYIIVTEKKRRRPPDDPDRVYNEGGTSFADAPLVPLDTHYWGALSILEVPSALTSPAGGQYFKVNLEPNEGIVFTADLLGEGGLYSPGVDLYIWDPSRTDPVRWWYWVVSCGVPTGEVCRKAVDTASQPFVNPYTTTTVFYVSIRSRWEYLHEFRLGIYRNTQQLTLFLDADNNFDPASPRSDIDRYLPCATLDGKSVPIAECPQIVKVIAAYTVGNGEKIVTPPTTGTVRFELQETSAFVGVAMNFGSGTEPDFALPGNASSIDVGWADKTSRFDLTSRDYGGFTSVHATHNANAAVMDVPRRNGLLPEGGWEVYSTPLVHPPEHVDASGRDADSDEDATPEAVGPPVDPEGRGLHGDGLTTLQEYRGFVELGTHIRTHPDKKDVFIAGDDEPNGFGIGYAANLPLSVHHVCDPEVALGCGQREYSESRIVNGNRANAAGNPIGGEDQRGIKLLVLDRAVDPLLARCVYGYTFGVAYPRPLDLSFSPTELSPNETATVEVYLEPHRWLGDAQFFGECAHPDITRVLSAPEVEAATFVSMGHETGHALHVCHIDDTQSGGRAYDCAGGSVLQISNPDPSVMYSRLRLPIPLSTDPGAQYSPTDAGQIRLHVRR